MTTAPSQPAALDPSRPFREKVHGRHPRSQINPYVDLHEQMRPTVVTAHDALDWRGNWSKCFGRAAPLHVEVGSGNGFFLAGMAARHPDRNWLGIEIRFKRVVLCARKLRAANTPHARIARYDAWWLDDLFGPASLDGLYVNHPDPWMKTRQAGKRLMGRYFAEFAAWALKPGAELRLKSDFAPNLDGLEAGAVGLPLEILGRSSDVRGSGLPWDAEDDITTNYQSKFDRRDAPVHALRVRRVPGPALAPAVDHQSGPRASTVLAAKHAAAADEE